MCKQQQHSSSSSSSDATTISKTKTIFTIEDVTKNNSPQSAYTLYKNKILDITQFAKRHPGGDIILLAAGKDATVLVETYHPKGVPMAVIDKLTVSLLLLLLLLSIFSILIYILYIYTYIYFSLFFSSRCYNVNKDWYYRSKTTPTILLLMVISILPNTLSTCHTTSYRT